MIDSRKFLQEADHLATVAEFVVIPDIEIDSFCGLHVLGTRCVHNSRAAMSDEVGRANLTPETCV